MLFILYFISMSGHAHTPYLDAIEHGYAQQAHKNYGVPMPKSDHWHWHGWHGHDAHHDDHWHGHGGSWAFSNVAWNAVATPFRGAGTVWYAGLDLAKALTIEPVKNVAQITSDSVDDVSKLFQEAGKRWKRYHKALNLPLAGVLSGAKTVEWACRSVVNTGWNALHNTFDVVKGGVKNAFKTLTSVFSTKPMSDFSFDHLKTKPTWKTFDLTKFLVWGNSGWWDDHAHEHPVAAHH